MASSSLTETYIVQDFLNDDMPNAAFRLALIGWIVNASGDEIHALAHVLSDGSSIPVE